MAVVFGGGVVVVVGGGEGVVVVLGDGVVVVEQVGVTWEHVPGSIDVVVPLAMLKHNEQMILRSSICTVKILVEPTLSSRRRHMSLRCNSWHQRYRLVLDTRL